MERPRLSAQRAPPASGFDASGFPLWFGLRSPHSDQQLRADLVDFLHHLTHRITVLEGQRFADIVHPLRKLTQINFGFLQTLSRSRRGVGRLMRVVNHFANLGLAFFHLTLVEEIVGHRQLHVSVFQAKLGLRSARSCVGACLQFRRRVRCQRRTRQCEDDRRISEEAPHSTCYSDTYLRAWDRVQSAGDAPATPGREACPHRQPGTADNIPPPAVPLSSCRKWWHAGSRSPAPRAGISRDSPAPATSTDSSCFPPPLRPGFRRHRPSPASVALPAATPVAIRDTFSRA